MKSETVPAVRAANVSGDPRAGAPPEIHLAEYWAVLVKRRRLVLAAVAIAFVVALLLGFISQPLYKATAILNVEREKGGPLDIGSGAGVYDWYNPEFLPTQTRLMKSRETAERAVVRMNLLENPEFNPQLSGASRQIAKGGATKNPAEGAQAITRAAMRIQGGIETAPIRGTNLVELSYTATSAKLAADVANALAEAYIDWKLETKYQVVGQASQFLGKQIEQLKGEVDEKERELQAYGRQKDIISVDPGQNVTLQKLEALNKDYASAVADRVSKEARYYEMQSAKPDAMADTLSNGLVSQLRNDLLKSEREYAEKLNVYRPEWPAMLQLKTQIQKGREHLDSVIEETVAKAKENARADYQTAHRREESLKEVLRAQKTEAMTLNSNAVEYNNLRVEVSTKRTLMDTLLKRQSETEVMSRLRGTRESGVRVVDRALPPSGPFSPSYRRNGMLGLFLGLAFGVGLSFFLEYLDRSIRTTEQVEQLLGLPALGVIPAVGTAGIGGVGYGTYGIDEQLKARFKVRRTKTAAKVVEREDKVSIEGLPHVQQRSFVAEAYRLFRTSVLLSRADGWRTLVITSSIPGEGKTSTALNLAIVLGQLGRKVLLVDADLHKPRLHEVVRISNRAGLVTVLAEGGEVGAVIQRTEFPGVVVMPSGPLAPNPSGLISSKRMEQLLEMLCREFDHVIFDSPPVQPVADALLLGRMCDGLVICVKGGATPREIVVRSRDKLQRAGAKILGVLINNLPQHGKSYSTSKYDYDYGYGYGKPREGEGSAGKPGEAAGVAAVAAVAGVAGVAAVSLAPEGDQPAKAG